MLTSVDNSWHTRAVADTADRLREAMTAAGYDQTSLARELGVHPKTLQNWLTGKFKPRRADQRAALANLLGVDVYDGRSNTPFRRLEDVPDQEFVAELARRLAQRPQRGEPFVVTDTAALRVDDDPEGTTQQEA